MLGCILWLTATNCRRAGRSDSLSLRPRQAAVLSGTPYYYSVNLSAASLLPARAHTHSHTGERERRGAGDREREEERWRSKDREGAVLSPDIKQLLDARPVHVLDRRGHRTACCNTDTMLQHRHHVATQFTCLIDDVIALQVARQFALLRSNPLVALPAVNARCGARVRAVKGRHRREDRTSWLA